jgi:hypothetical protein
MSELIKGVPTMTSIELVVLINSKRGKGEKVLKHNNFLAKIEKHPGITSAKFLAHVDIPGPNGAVRKSKCYVLPKRECELMVMSESLEVQTRVYDRLASLQSKAEDHKRLRHEAAASFKVMTQVLLLRRGQEGKKCAPHHFMNEARMINQALTGEFKGLNRDDLTIEQLDALAKLEVNNAVLIASGRPYQDRKVEIAALAGGNLLR